MILALTITHVVISLALVIIVLLQQGKQQGLSGAIAGAGETFFGKSKARTIDAMLKKFTTIVAALFIINSVGLYIVISADNRANAPQGQGEHMFDPGDLAPQQVGFVEDGVVFEIGEDGTVAPVEGLIISEDGTSILFENEAGEWIADDMLELRADGSVWFDPSAMMLPGDFDPDVDGGQEISHEELEEILRQAGLEPGDE